MTELQINTPSFASQALLSLSSFYCFINQYRIYDEGGDKKNTLNNLNSIPIYLTT